MTDVGIGALGYVGYAKESSEGTSTGPTIFLPARSVSFQDANDYQMPAQIRGNRDDEVAMPAPFPVTGTMELDLIADGIGYLLKSAFAAAVNTSAYSGGGYTHVLTPGNTSPTFSVETSAQDLLVMRYLGVRVNTMEVKAAFGEIVTATFGLDGVDREKQGSSADPEYTDSSLTPFHFNTVVVNIGGSPSTVVKDFTFNVNNNVSHIGTLRGTRAYKRVAMGRRALGLKLSLDFADSTEYQRLLNDSEFAVSMYMEGPDLTGNAGSKTSLLVELPRVRYKTVGLPISAGDFLTQDVDCTVLRPNGDDIATVTLVCNDASLA